MAKRAETSRTAIYRRWDTREALVASALRSFRADSEAGLEDWTNWPLLAILDQFVRRAAAALNDGFARDLIRQLVALGPDGDAITQTYLAEMFTPRRDAFSAKIREAQADGQIDRSLDPEIMQDLLAGALIHKMLLWGDHATNADPRAYVEAVLESIGFPSRRGQHK
ncbi:hypothetical protein BH708_05110 [Brachybacterium sp. P6-10-X1]|nr:hypothetical protein BH708_05110 [Brachybacterium sp. P6-10-X1]